MIAWWWMAIAFWLGLGLGVVFWAVAYSTADGDSDMNARWWRDGGDGQAEQADERPASLARDLDQA
jgi:hypothetical protein